VSGRQLSFELAGGPYAVTAARLALAEIDELLDESHAFDVRLLVSELVTNSVQHAKVGPEDSIEMRLAVDGELIRVEISDSGPGFEPPVDAGGTERDRGWGLFFVSQLAHRWGVEPGEPGCVWFEIDRASAGEGHADQTAA
jgi:anti-sigma regulatory factor (Ser/Thr protein kinase)